MSSSEAQSDFPDEKQRLAVAYSMYGERGNGFQKQGNDPAWPKLFECSYIEPGVVAYGDLGPCKVCGDAFSCGNAGDACQPEGATILVEQDALERMQNSFVGKPVTIDHQEVDPSTVSDGEAEGVVTRVWRDAATGWFKCEFLVWTPEAQEHAADTKWSVSCAYDPLKTDDTGGEWHSVHFASRMLEGQYTHLALVENPRYEKARINPVLLNSKVLANRRNRKGGSMLEGIVKWWKKGGSRTNALTANPDEKVDLGNGKEASFKELMSALDEPKPKFNDDDAFETPHGDKSFKELKENWLKKNDAGGIPDPKPGEALNPDKGAAKAEPGHVQGEAKNAEPDKCKECGALKNAPEKDGKGEEKPLPDLKDPKANDSDARSEGDPEAEAKKLEAAKDKEEKEAFENAKKAAGRKSFEELRNARLEVSPEGGRAHPVDMGERLQKGLAKYGKS
jgi:hypothetical protein